MATASATELDFLYEKIMPKKEFHIAIVTAKWNWEINGVLESGAEQFLLSCGKIKISKHYVPGAYELSLGSQKLAQRPDVDAVVSIGCVIKGDTPHFEYICQAVTQGITQVSLKYDKPVIFGVLTTNTLEQAKERAGGKLGNKGAEAAASALHMLNQF
jgi:6,7-dimethyl-8-ribityllumazine synthase